jgi:hypothetical protein
MDASAARSALRRFATAVLVLFAAFWLFLEEWLWDRLASLMAAVSRLPAVRAAARRIAALPPYAAIALFLIPVAIMFPFKLAGLWLLARGRVGAGVAVFVVAKVLGTSLITWIFVQCRETLLTVGWFAALHACYLRLRLALHERLEEIAAWRAARAWARSARGMLDRWRRP